MEALPEAQQNWHPCPASVGEFVLHGPQWWATKTKSFIRRVLRDQGTNPGGHRTHLGTQVKSRRPGRPALPTKCHHNTLGAAPLPQNWKPNAQRRPLALNAGHPCWNHCLLCCQVYPTGQATVTSSCERGG